jgi:ATP-dependent exoDNAse (exonuclease V) beta subunit
MQESAIRALFTPSGNNDEALRELPFQSMEHGDWWSGVLDRLVVRKGADGRPVKAELIDFKTDAIESLETLRERYAGQLEIYRRACSSALGLGIADLRVVLVSTSLKQLLVL